MAFGPTGHGVGKGSWSASLPHPPGRHCVGTGIQVDAVYLCFRLSIFPNETVRCFVPNLLTDFCSLQPWLCRRTGSWDCGYTFRVLGPFRVTWVDNSIWVSSLPHSLPRGPGWSPCSASGWVLFSTRPGSWEQIQGSGWLPSVRLCWSHF